MAETWYRIANETDVPSPTVLLFPNRIRENIRRMIGIAGGTGRLRPHVKTHKLPQVVRMQVEAGIRRFKCVTLSEARMTAENGGTDILIAYPLYGPALAGLFRLMHNYPHVQFSTLVDHAAQAKSMAQQAGLAGVQVDVFLDLNVGMDRTGIMPGPEASDLYRLLARTPALHLRGLHIYDGHLRQEDPAEREAACKAYFNLVNAWLDRLHDRELLSRELVCGGTPTFPIHAQYSERTLSPGTVLLWDWGYSTRFPDLDFQHAAVLFSRVLSWPAPGKLCLDLGHKALASEMPPPRVHLLNIPDAVIAGHSEEHMVVSCAQTDTFLPGDAIYGVPVHICPTMALHDRVWAVSDGRAAEKWTVSARTREW